MVVACFHFSIINKIRSFQIGVDRNVLNNFFVQLTLEILSKQKKKGDLLRSLFSSQIQRHLRLSKEFKNHSELISFVILLVILDPIFLIISNGEKRLNLKGSQIQRHLRLSKEFKNHSELISFVILLVILDPIFLIISNGEKRLNLKGLFNTVGGALYQLARMVDLAAFEQFGDLFVAVSSKVLHSITTSMSVVSSLPSPSKGGNPSSSAKKEVDAESKEKTSGFNSFEDRLVAEATVGERGAQLPSMNIVRQFNRREGPRFYFSKKKLKMIVEYYKAMNLYKSIRVYNFDSSESLILVDNTITRFFLVGISPINVEVGNLDLNGDNGNVDGPLVANAQTSLLSQLVPLVVNSLGAIETRLLGRLIRIGELVDQEVKGKQEMAPVLRIEPQEFDNFVLTTKTKNMNILVD
ncbi:hypothetical protein Syun_009299 [Stephania yunnanensis]|uniref:Uncharacterized protein n=1 Tax=Stephania yunnanensis TaxID=152371 RepID=A0AAP0KGW0_9MAGN